VVRPAVLIPKSIPRTFLDRLGTAVLLSDPITGEIVYANHRCAKLLGYDDDELAAQRRSVRDVTHHADHKRNVAEHQKLIRRELDEYGLELRVRRKTGEFVWVHIVATLLRDGRGRPQWCAVNLKQFSSADIVEQQLAAA
jgi:PAS domain S-box-containing protein